MKKPDRIWTEEEIRTPNWEPTAAVILLVVGVIALVLVKAGVI